MPPPDRKEGLTMQEMKDPLSSKDKESLSALRRNLARAEVKCPGLKFRNIEECIPDSTHDIKEMMETMKAGALAVREYPNEAMEYLEYLKSDKEFDNLKKFADEVYYYFHPEEIVEGAAIEDEEELKPAA